MDWERIYDARTAGGKIPKRPGDYSVFAPGLHIWIEVKETQHNSRIDKSKLTQIPKLTVREMAGGTIIILVYHTKTKKWRAPPFYLFGNNPSAASWDLSELPEFDSLEDAMLCAARFTGTIKIWRFK